jgi:hypothetical protein
MTPEQRVLVARIAATRRHQPDDIEAATELRRNLKASRAETYIQRIVDEGPELSPSQRSRLASLLVPA